MSAKKRRTSVVRGSGNVFADLGFVDADARLAKAELARTSRLNIQKREMTPRSAAAKPGLAMPSTAARDVRLTVRLSRSEKTLLQRAAAGRGQTLSAYVIEKARAAAMADLEAAGEIVLSAADQRQFVELLLSPPPLNERMRRALALAKSVAAAE